MNESSTWILVDFPEPVRPIVQVGYLLLMVSKPRRHKGVERILEPVPRESHGGGSDGDPSRGVCGASDVAHAPHVFGD